MAYQIFQNLKKANDGNGLDRREFIKASAEGLTGLALVANGLYLALNPKEAIAGEAHAAEKAYAATTKDARTENWQGIQLYRKKHYKQALEKFQNVIEINPDYADAYIMAGRTHYELKEPETAIAYSKKALEMQGPTLNQQRRIYKDLAKSYLSLGKKELAREYIEKYEAMTIQQGKMNNKLRKVIQNIRNQL